MYKLGTNTFGLDKYLLSERVRTYEKLYSFGYRYLEPCIFTDKDLEIFRDRIVFGGATWDRHHLNEMITEVKNYGLDVMTIFVQYLPTTDIDELIETILQTAAKTGVKRYISAPRLSTKEEAETAADNVNRIAAVLKKNGLNYYYHNHDREFEKISFDGKEEYIFDYFVSMLSDDVYLEADIGWMQMKNIDPAQFILRYKDKVKLVHLNDLRLDRKEDERHTGWCAFGEGVINYQNIVNVLKQLDLDNDTIIVDQEWAKNDMLEEMKTNAKNIMKGMDFMNTRLSHVGLNVSNMEKSLQFYTEIMGFERAFSFHLDDKPWIEFVRIAPNQYVELFYEKPNREYSYVNGSYKHLSIDVTDTKLYAEQIRNKGIELFREPGIGPDGNLQFWVKDPDGHQIEIIQIDGNSPHGTFEKNQEYAVYKYYTKDFQ